MSPRNRASARDAGARLERATADHLARHVAPGIDRRVRNGALDRGDVGGVFTTHGARVVIECKDVRTTALGSWVREAEVERVNDGAIAAVVVHKRTGVGYGNAGQQYVTCTLDDLVALLTGRRPSSEPVPEPPAQEGPTLLDVLDADGRAPYVSRNAEGTA